MQNIVLIGMPGSGKTTVGTYLSEYLGYGYIDSDSVIVAREGKLLSDLIEEYGNEGFLDIEAKVNSSISAYRCVIATGGSAIYRGDAIDKMRKNGVVVYLKISYEEMARRLGDFSKRGVVLKDGYTLLDLYNERTPLYEKHADYVVELDGLTIEESVGRIKEKIQCELTD
jgi:shikimate kinase